MVVVVNLVLACTLPMSGGLKGTEKGTVKELRAGDGRAGLYMCVCQFPKMLL